MTASALWEFDYLVEGNASHAQANTIFNMMEALAHISVIDRDLTTPPGSPNNGDVYLVGASATGDWAGQDGKYAIYYDGWIANEAGDFPQPRTGQIIFIEDESVELMYDGTGFRIGICTSNVEGPDQQRVFKCPIPVDISSAFQTVANTAYFCYVGRVNRRITPQYVAAHCVIAGGGSVTAAECGIFSTPSAPNKAAQTLTKIEATGTMATLTTTGMKRNSSAFTTAVEAGVHLWAGHRSNMTGTEPQWVGLAGDFREGFVLATTGATSFTSGTTWSGSLIALSSSGLAPDMRVEID